MRAGLGVVSSSSQFEQRYIPPAAVVAAKLRRIQMLRFLRLAEVIKRTGYSRPTIYRKMHLSEFPLAYSLGAGESSRSAVGWKEEDIEAWLSSRAVALPQKSAVSKAANPVRTGPQPGLGQRARSRAASRGFGSRLPLGILYSVW